MTRLHLLDPAFLKELLMMLGGSRKPVFLIVMAVMAVPGLLFVVEKWPGFFALELGAGALTLIFTVAGGFFIYPRFLAGLLPLFAVAAGSAVMLPSWIFYSRSARLSRILSGLASAALIFMLVPGLFNYYRLGKQGFKDAAAYLAEHRENRPVICYGIICPELKYYYHGPLLEVGEKEELTPGFLKDKLIISRRVDWTRANLELVHQYCTTRKVWKSAGYKENLLWLVDCR